MGQHEPAIEHIYLVLTDGQWDVTALADDNHDMTPARIMREVEHRATSRGRDHVHVWRTRIADLIEVELIPARILVPGEPENDR